MTERPDPIGGVQTRAPDSLLVERARDFLAGGPSDATTLVTRVCQLPGLKREMADRIALELLAPHREFVLDGEGRWSLAPVAQRREAGAPIRAATAVVPAVPSFDEWRAARATRQSDEPTAPTPSSPSSPSSPSARRTRERRAAVADLPRRGLPGDDQPLFDLSYVVVDVETTGGSPLAGHRITEIAAVVVAGGEVREVYETLVNPERVIPPQIVRLTGITAEMVRGKPAFREVAGDVLNALQGHVFVAHNVTFDWRFVSHEVERASGVSLEGRRLCTVRLARKLLPHLRSRSLGYVADWYGADAFARTYFEGRHGASRPWRHSAAGDAVATAHCLVRLLHDAREHGVHTWGDLDRWLSGGTGAARRRRRSALPSAVDRDTTA
ncbi:MAG: 3'-5' exonuclease [Gemmatirosa sp.]